MRAYLVLLLFFSLVGPLQAQPLKEGDLIFQISQSPQAEMIQRVTDSPYTHVGVVFFQDGQPWVLEAVQPVKATPLKAFVARGVRQHYVVKRLKYRDVLLSPVVLARLREVGRTYLGRDYDGDYAWSDERLYCSELAWKLYRSVGIEIGDLQRYGDLDLSDPATRAYIRDRRGAEGVDPEEPIITPARMLQAPCLVTVFQSP